MQTHAPSTCPIENCLHLISSKWKVLILWKLMQHPALRFSDLQRAIPSITKKMLTQQLRQLEADQLVSRTASPDLPLKVEYALTEFGSTLMPIFQAITHWSDTHSTRSDLKHDSLRDA
jgi:DNA-binding HxlR family transcriptional regulator